MIRRNKIWLLAYFIFMLILVGCSPIDENHGKQSNQSTILTDTSDNKDNDANISISIGWEFIDYVKKDTNGFENPYSDVYLIVKGDKEEKIKIGTYIGSFSIYDDVSNRNYPTDTLTACETWFAGAGDDIRVVRSDSKTLSVQWREKEEGSEEIEPYISEFKQIKTVVIPNNAEIEVIKTNS